MSIGFIDTQTDEVSELTVTIPLSEYRNLIREQAQAEMQIELLEEKLNRAKESGQAFMKLLFLKSPEVVNKICELYNEFFPSGETKAEEIENDERRGNENDTESASDCLS